MAKQLTDSRSVATIQSRSFEDYFVHFKVTILEDCAGLELWANDEVGDTAAVVQSGYFFDTESRFLSALYHCMAGLEAMLDGANSKVYPDRLREIIADTLQAIHDQK